MIQLNLLPDLKKEFLKAQKAKGVVISVSILVTLGAIGLSVLLFVYVTFVQQLQINLASGEIETQMKQLKDIPDVDKYLTIQNQLAALPALHSDKGNYSRMLDFLSTLNPGAPNSMELSNLQLSTVDKSIIFSGTTHNYRSFNIFVDTLKNAEVSYLVGGQGDPVTEKMFDSVKVQNSGFNRSGANSVVGFTVKTVYKDSVFAVGNTNMTINVPNITTTPSVVDSPKPTSDQNNTPEGQ